MTYTSARQRKIATGVLIKTINVGYIEVDVYSKITYPIYIGNETKYYAYGSEFLNLSGVSNISASTGSIQISGQEFETNVSTTIITSAGIFDNNNVNNIKTFVTFISGSNQINQATTVVSNDISGTYFYRSTTPVASANFTNKSNSTMTWYVKNITGGQLYTNILASNTSDNYSYSPSLTASYIQWTS